MNFEPSILVVDDEIDSLQYIISLLLECKTQYRILQANSAKTAYEIVNKKMPDLIICDWNMPKESGIDLIQKLKNDEETTNIPVIITTAYMLQKSDLKMALDVGAMDYLPKPIQAIELEARINSAIHLIQSHKNVIQLKNEELEENSLHLLKINEFLQSIPVKIRALKHLSPNALSDLEKFERELSFIMKKLNWDRFENSFTNLHPRFYNKLLKQFPLLTPKELKLAALIFLGMKTKDVALLLNQEPASIKTARYRLRKKLNLSEKENLELFFAQFR